jgi:hypothetical protein
MPTNKETHIKNLQRGKQRGEAAGGKSGGPKVSPPPRSASARANAMKKKYGLPKVSSNKSGKPGDGEKSGGVQSNLKSGKTQTKGK